LYFGSKEEKIMKKEIAKINALLIKEFGIPPRNTNKATPLDTLIGTILSQNTNDNNSFKAYSKLKCSFKNWDEIEKLPLMKLERLINVAGLGFQKATAIKKVLSYLKSERGSLSLDYLVDNSDEEILTELTSFQGVGLKTASCVLLFSLERNVCPVDTHVHRTLNRIGIVKTSSPDKTFLALKNFLPEKSAHTFHTNLIRLGRAICKPAKPGCAVCPLLKICQYEEKNLEKGGVVTKRDFMLLDNL